MHSTGHDAAPASGKARTDTAHQNCYGRADPLRIDARIFSPRIRSRSDDTRSAIARNGVRESTQPRYRLMPTPDLAVFPLSTVVFPGGILPLRIFEPRYLDMVSHCMKNAEDFVICAARPAALEDSFSEPRDIGTRVSIVDFDRLDDGQLGITGRGTERVAIADTHQSGNGQWWGAVTAWPETEDGPCPIEFAVLKQVAAAMIKDSGRPYEAQASNYDSASWLSARLTELLPFDAATKHELLAIDDPRERLCRLRPMIDIENSGGRAG